MTDRHATCSPNPEVAHRRRAARHVADRLVQEDDITSLAIFGSVATDQAGPDSDLDLCGTYRGAYDKGAFLETCKEIGLDPAAVTGSAQPDISMTGLRVNGVHIGLMLGPESELLNMADQAATVEREVFEQQMYSFAVAEVLFDKAEIWDGVIQKLRAAAQRFGIACPAERRSLDD